MKTTPEQRADYRRWASREEGLIAFNHTQVNDLLDDLDDLEEVQRNLEEALENPRDQYHTMDELYWYRMLYNALAANAMPQVAVKSWRHSDGELCFGGGWFVVYLLLPTGQVSNHYKAEYWDLFQIPQIEKAPEYDGHTPQVVAERLLAFVSSEPVHNSVQDLTARCARLSKAVGVASLRLAEESARVGELTSQIDRVRAIPIGPSSGGYYMVSMREILDTLDGEE